MQGLGETLAHRDQPIVRKQQRHFPRPVMRRPASMNASMSLPRCFVSEPCCSRAQNVSSQPKSRSLPTPPQIRWRPFTARAPPTRRAQLTTAKAAAAVEAPSLPYRVGHGFDLHRLEEGYPLIIGGIPIPHTRGCVAHSDGDVLLHCITDALLGALSMPDIGQLFPDNDPKWKGANSDVFIKEAMRLMREKGYHLGNIDATIIAERPKLSPFKEQIRNNLCSLLEAHPSVVNIKAKTHEKVDSLGENRSIGCHTVVMLIRDDSHQ